MWQIYVVLGILMLIFLYFRYSWSSRWDAFDNAMRAQYGSAKGRRVTIIVALIGVAFVLSFSALYWLSRTRVLK